MRMIRGLCIAAAVLGLVACGGKAAPFTGQPMATIQTQSGTLKVSVECDYEPPTFGVHEFHFTITDAAGHPQTGLQLNVKPWAPEMNHGSSTIPTVKELGNGLYDISDVYLTMKGQWELIVTITAPAMDAFTTPTFDVS